MFFLPKEKFLQNKPNKDLLCFIIKREFQTHSIFVSENVNHVHFFIFSLFIQITAKVLREFLNFLNNVKFSEKANKSHEE